MTVIADVVNADHLPSSIPVTTIERGAISKVGLSPAAEFA